MALHKGWDVFQTEPGKCDSMKCRVCNEEMDLKRNVDGSTSSGEAMLGKSHLHDVFTCNNSKNLWHKQVLKLREAIIATPSAKLAEIYLQEINEILFSRRETKEVKDY